MKTKTPKPAGDSRRSRAPRQLAPKSTSVASAAGILGQLAAACRTRRSFDDQDGAIDRAAGAAVELVKVLKAEGVNFAAPDRAPEQIAASILATYQLAAAGPRGADVDFMLIASGMVDGLRHALTSDGPAHEVALSILAPAPVRRGGR